MDKIPATLEQIEKLETELSQLEGDKFEQRLDTAIFWLEATKKSTEKLERSMRNPDAYLLIEFDRKGLEFCLQQTDEVIAEIAKDAWRLNRPLDFEDLARAIRTGRRKVRRKTRTFAVGSAVLAFAKEFRLWPTREEIEELLKMRKPQTEKSYFSRPGVDSVAYLNALRKGIPRQSVTDALDHLGIQHLIASRKRGPKG